MIGPFERNMPEAPFLESFLFVVDPQGEIRINHIASLEVAADNQLKVQDWFLPEVISYLKEESPVTLMILNTQNHRSYQVNGKCMDIKGVAFLERITTLDTKYHFPKVKWELDVEIDTVRELNRL